MGLQLYNTLTRSKEVFVPIDRQNVRMYVCGPTVYDYAHIGNARPLIVFDVLFRLLRHIYGPEHVTYVRNITDVDDKINARAARDFPDLPLNEAIRQVTQTTERQFHEDVAALGCLPPTVEPRATEYISRPQAPTDMIRLIEALLQKGHAYVAEGHVLFHVPSMPDYGRLANRTPDEMQAGARVEVAPFKKDPTDFVLWKPSAPGEPAWPSPWGAGRPGWHLECSAMAGALLGEVFDIHGGGIDLVFPHHENEIAQSRCAHGTSVMANYWLHNGFLQVEGEKMAKSAGNFVTVRDLLDGWDGRLWHGEIIRFAMLKTHYRQPVDWTVQALEEGTRVLERWYLAIDSVLGSESPDDIVDEELVDEEFLDALCDDLNTPRAIGRLHKIYDEIKGPASGQKNIPLQRTLKASAQILGLMAVPAKAFLTRKVRPEVIHPEKVELLIADRRTARQDKDYAEADRIRAELDAMGIALKDAKDPETGELVTTWEVKR